MPRDVDEMLDVIKERHRDEARRLRAAQRRLAVPIKRAMQYTPYRSVALVEVASATQYVRAFIRAAVEKGVALVPSSKKRGGPGQVLDIPLGHKDAAYVRSHFDGMEVSLSDAPRADEILVAIAVTDSGRPLPRVGGLTAAEAEGKDGLR